MISLISTIQRYQVDTPADIKPEAPDGSTCHVISTGEKWVMHDGMWERDKRQDGN